MTYYSVKLTNTAEKQLRKIAHQDRPRIVAALQGLSANPRPHGIRKMQGYDAVYRMRVGSYRVIYEVIDQQVIVIVLKLGHRKDVYR